MADESILFHIRQYSVLRVESRRVWSDDIVWETIVFGPESV